MDAPQNQISKEFIDRLVLHLENVQSAQAEMAKAQAEDVIHRNYLSRDLEEIKLHLYGKGDAPGIRGNVLTLMSVEENRKWLLRVLYASVLGLLVEAVWAHILKF